MSANDIPDLRTLLGQRRGGVNSRGRGTARGGPIASREAAADNAVRNTDQDAAGSRVSCVELGYLDDPYAKLFASQPATRRLPLLNRGSYVRTSAIDMLVDRFMTTSPSSPKQIVSLGAGTDTRYFRLRDKYPDAQLTYHELDFPANTTAKLSSITKHEALRSKLHPDSPSIDPGATSYNSPTYNLHALDLRTLAEQNGETPPQTLPNLSPTTPTLLLSEMCLCYLRPTTVSALLSNLTTTLLPPPTPLSIILYEPILPNDAFGRTMTSNLRMRNISLPTLSAYPELGDQRARMKAAGFVDGSRAADTEWIWRHWVSGGEKERVAGLEMLDEFEELELLLRHYCVAWAWRDGDSSIFGDAWGGVDEQGGG